MDSNEEIRDILEFIALILFINCVIDIISIFLSH
jgi:hypothetical protein